MWGTKRVENMSLPKEAQCRKRIVGDFTQCLEEVARLGDALGCVSPTESVITNWAAQQFKVPIGLRSKLRGELAVGDVSLVASARHKQAFLSTHSDFDAKSRGSDL